MGLAFYYCEPPEYHRLHVSHELAVKLVEAGNDNRHFFIDREAVEELLANPEVTEDERGKLKEWLAARPDDDELYFSYDG